MKFFTFLSVLGTLILSCDASHYILEKRATQVSVSNYALTNNILAGSIMVIWSLEIPFYIALLTLIALMKIQNIAFSKVVTIIYAVGSTWSDNQKFSASYSGGPATNGYETWTFSGTATGATQFYIKYDVSGTS